MKYKITGILNQLINSFNWKDLLHVRRGMIEGAATRIMEQLGGETDWNKLREQYFEECCEVIYKSYSPISSMKRVAMAPHDLFEWFKKRLSNPLKEEPVPSLRELKDINEFRKHIANELTREELIDRLCETTQDYRRCRKYLLHEQLKEEPKDSAEERYLKAVKYLTGSWKWKVSDMRHAPSTKEALKIAAGLPPTVETKKD